MKPIILIGVLATSPSERLRVMMRMRMLMMILSNLSLQLYLSEKTITKKNILNIYLCIWHFLLFLQEKYAPAYSGEYMPLHMSICNRTCVIWSLNGIEADKKKHSSHNRKLKSFSSSKQKGQITLL